MSKIWRLLSSKPYKQNGEWPFGAVITQGDKVISQNRCREAPEIVRQEIKPLRAMVANTFVAEPLARALQRMGIGVIRGAGPNWRGQDRGMIQ
jgi:hypothetical protein